VNKVPRNEATIPRSTKTTQAKRSRELLKQARNQEKEERRAQRKAEKAKSQRSSDVDSDIAGIVPGPQVRVDDGE
jgi:hypothetical protein